MYIHESIYMKRITNKYPKNDNTTSGFKKLKKTGSFSGEPRQSSSSTSMLDAIAKEEKDGNFTGFNNNDHVSMDKRRMEHLLNRTYFLERRKQEQGLLAFHPALQAKIVHNSEGNKILKSDNSDDALMNKSNKNEGASGKNEGASGKNEGASGNNDSQNESKHQYKQQQQQQQQQKSKKWEVYFSNFLSRIIGNDSSGSSHENDLVGISSKIPRVKRVSLDARKRCSESDAFYDDYDISPKATMENRIEQSVDNCNLFANFDWKRKEPLTSFDVMKVIVKNEYTHQMSTKHPILLPIKGDAAVMRHGDNSTDMMVAQSLFSELKQGPTSSYSQKVSAPSTATTTTTATTAATAATATTATTAATAATATVETSSKIATPSVDALLRATFTDFHNNDKLGGYNDNTSAYLGENSSHRDIPSYLSQHVSSLSIHSLHSWNESPTDDVPCLSEANTKRCFLKLPITKFVDEAGEALATLTRQSWMLPYIVVNTKPELLSYVLVTAMEKVGLVDNTVMKGSISYSSIFSSSKLSPGRSPTRKNMVTESPRSAKPSTLFPTSTPRQLQRKHSVDHDLSTSVGSSLSDIYTCSLGSPSGSWNSSGSDNSLDDKLDKTRSFTEEQVSTFKPWACLGKLLVTRNIDKDTFQQRIIFVADNYLFETLVSNESPVILGYLPLCSSKISIEDTGSSRGGKAIKVEFNILSQEGQTNRGQIFMRTLNDEDLSRILRDMTFLANLSVDNIYHVERDKALGTGRCNEVLLAKRKIYENSFLEELIELHSTSVIDQPVDGMEQRIIRTESSDFLAHRDTLSTTPSPLSVKIPSSGSSTYLQSFTSPQSSTAGSANSYYKNASFMSCKSLTDLKQKNYISSPSTSKRPESSSALRKKNRYCALKIVNKSTFWERVEDGKERSDSIIREVLAQAASWLKGAEDPTRAHRLEKIPIVQIYNIMETMEEFILELELMESNDLFDELSESGGHFSEEAVQNIAVQLVDAASLCYQSGFGHRDIKLQNITFPLIGKGMNHSCNMNIKLADFGMAGFRGNDGLMRGRCGTPGYVAPEIFMAGKREGYDPNVDIFSVGVVLYTLLCGYEPFYGEDDQELIMANKSVQYEFHSPEWDGISENAKDFIKNCLKPRDRFTPMDALEHSWLKAVAVRRMSDHA